MLQPAVYNRNIFWLKHELSMKLSYPALLIAKNTYVPGTPETRSFSGKHPLLAAILDSKACFCYW